MFLKFHGMVIAIQMLAEYISEHREELLASN